MPNHFIANEIVENLKQLMIIATKNSVVEGADVAENQHTLRYFSGCAYPFFNGVFSSNLLNQTTLKTQLTEITEYFIQRKTGFIWWWTHPTPIPAELKTELDDKGFQFMGDFLGMAAPLNELQTVELDTEITVKKVISTEDYALFLDIFCDVFQMSAAMKADLQFMYQSYGTTGVFKHYLGYYQNKPVATLTSYINGSVVGLYNGATQEKFQKKGLCAALAQYALKEAQDLNCEYAVSQLMTPGMAKGISEKMGFKKVCVLHPYLFVPG